MNIKLQSSLITLLVKAMASYDENTEAQRVLGRGVRVPQRGFHVSCMMEDNMRHGAELCKYLTGSTDRRC